MTNSRKLNFTVRTATIFERSHVPLHKWIYAMYLLVTSRKGISSMQLAKEIGVRQGTAWFILQRLREACGADIAKLRGTVEMDEVYLGGKEQYKHMSKRMYGDRGLPDKTAVVGTRERYGRTIAFPVESTGARSLEQAALENIEIGSTIHTGETRVIGFFARITPIKTSIAAKMSIPRMACPLTQLNLYSRLCAVGCTASITMQVRNTCGGTSMSSLGG